MIVIGLISGTSADGIDAALMEISGGPPEGSLSLLRYETIPYPKGLQRRLIELPAQGSVSELCHMHFYLGELFAEAAVKIAAKAGLDIQKVDLIGSHGQTVYHLPAPIKERGKWIRSTLQIGESSVIAERTGITTVGDFRSRDIAAGGQGAPLTPGFHYKLFSHPQRSRLIVNIGGISNLTAIPSGKGLGDVLAFDSGPGNMMIDEVVRRRTREKYRMDSQGRMAGRGKVHEKLLGELLRHPFLRQPPPKTTGREAFGLKLIDRILKRGKTLRISTEDLVSTVTLFTARSIAQSYFEFIAPRGKSDEVIVGGGGTLNMTLMRFLKDEFSPLPVKRFEDFGIDSKAIEAMAFALMAYEAVSGVPGNVPSATGAKEEVVLGKIVPGKRGVVYPVQSGKSGTPTSPPFPGIPASHHR
jgi:anhydro-N-acetylmuramic acid kinase